MPFLVILIILIALSPFFLQWFSRRQQDRGDHGLLSGRVTPSCAAIHSSGPLCRPIPIWQVRGQDHWQRDSRSGSHCLLPAFVSDGHMTLPAADALVRHGGGYHRRRLLVDARDSAVLEDGLEK